MTGLDGYFTRIGISRPATADLTALRDIVAAHARAIPFENLDPFTGREPGLDLGSITAKLVDGGRGGWCFEHNLLLRHVLDELGFTTTGLSSRVRRGFPTDAPPNARTHMMVRVDLPHGPYLVDVGFGGLTLTGVLALQTDVVQSTPHEPFRLTTHGRELDVEAQLAGEWSTLYRFDLTPTPDIDYDVGNFYLSHHPDSPFRHTIMLARPDPDRRYALLGRTLSTHHLGGPSETRKLSTEQEIRQVLGDVFGLDPAGIPGLDEALARLP